MPRRAAGPIAVILMLLTALPLAAQQGASVAGTVSDERGVPLPDVRIRVVGAEIGGLTDVRGRYRLTSVAAGEMTIVAERLGYSAAERMVSVAAGAVARVDFVLQERAVALEDVVVSVSREAQRRAETPATVNVLGSHAIEAAGAAHPSELLRRVPGAWVSVTGGEGHQTAIRQPLSTSPVYLYLEDGVPTRSTGFFNHNALYEINLPQADRVEVTKGPATALYGSDAIGGIINVGTRAPTSEPTLQAKAEAGSFGWSRVLLSGSGAHGDHGVRADLNLTRSDGWRTATDYSRQSGTVRWDASLGNRSSLRTVATYSNIDQSTAGSSAISEEDYRGDRTVNYAPISFRRVQALRLSSEFSVIGDNTLFTVTPFARWNEMDLLANWSLSYDPSLSTTGHRSLGVLAKVRRDFARLRARLIGGLDVDYSPGSRVEHALNTIREGAVYTSYELGERIYDYDVAFVGISPYLQAEASPIDRLRLVAGLRYDRVAYDYDNHLDPLDSGKHRRPADASPSYDHLSPKLGATYEVAPALNVFASYGHGFRAPSEGQLFRQGQAVNTVDLKPVKVDSYEAGVRGSLGERFRYEASAYAMTKTDDILAFTNPDGSRETVNAGETLHRGIELAAGVRLLPELRLDLGYSVARHTYERWEPKPGFELGGKEIETAPRVLANAVLTYEPPLLAGSRFGLEWTRVGRYWMDAENTHRYPGHDLLSLRANAPLVGNVSGFARLSNVMNRRFAESAGYTPARGTEYAPGMPRTLYIGLQVN